MEDNYSKAYKEVYEILKNIPEEDLNKIPEEIREVFESKQDLNYDFKIDPKKTFEEQNLLDETKAILANMYRDYWATDYQRERILEKERNDREKIEQEKREKYNPDDIFKNKNKKNITQQSEIDNNVEQQNETLPVIIEKEHFYNKLINFIKRIFHI